MDEKELGSEKDLDTSDPACIGYSVSIIAHTEQFFITLNSTQKVRDAVGSALDALGIEEEIDYTVEVTRVYGVKPNSFSSSGGIELAGFGSFLTPDEGKKVKTKKPCDSRCKNVTAKIFEAYKHYNKVNPPWGVVEGKMLKDFLVSHLEWPEEKIFDCIRNRWKSEENLALEPRRWISRLGDFAAGPLDKFGKPKSNGNGFHNGQQSRTNGSGATGHLLDHLLDMDEIERRRKADDLRLEEKRNARGM